MNERRVLITLLLLLAAAAFYIWGWQGGKGEGTNGADPEVEERTKANPFPS